MFLGDSFLDILVKRLDGLQGALALGASGRQRHLDKLVNLLRDCFPRGRVAWLATGLAAGFWGGVVARATKRGGWRVVLFLKVAQALVEGVKLQAQGGVFVEESVDLSGLAQDNGDERIGLRTQAIEKGGANERIHEIKQKGGQGERQQFFNGCCMENSNR